MRRRDPDELTDREREVLALLRRDFTNEQIAQRLGISVDGAKYHVSQILSKLGVATREEAAAWPQERRAWWRWPLWAKIAGATTILAVVGGIGVLIWDAVSTGEPGEEEAATVSSIDCEFSPSGAAGELTPDQIPVGIDGSAACWEEVPNAVQYAVDLTVNWYGNCEIFLGETKLSQEAASSRELERGSTRLEFPKPSDDRYDIPKDVFVDLRAVDEAGSEIARGGYGIQREVDYPSMCGYASGQVLANGEEIPFEECGSNSDWVQPPLERVMQHHYLRGVPTDQVRLTYERRFFGVAGGNGTLSANQGWLAASGLSQEGAESYIDPQVPPWGPQESCFLSDNAVGIRLYLLGYTAARVLQLGKSFVVQVDAVPTGYTAINIDPEETEDESESPLVIHYMDEGGNLLDSLCGTGGIAACGAARP